jgi:uncharacterized protein DUF4241
MPLPPSDFEQLFAPGARHTLFGEVVTIRHRQDASLWLPSGQVVAGEPFGFGVTDGSGGFLQRVPPGRYPLVLVLAVFGSDPDAADAHSIIAAAKLVIRDEPVTSWEMAVYEGQDVSTLGDDEFFGYPVDGGTGGFADAQSIAALCVDDDAYFDKVMAALDVREHDFVAPGVLTDDAGEPVVVAFSSGDGDGHYPTWIGRTADGEVACVLTDFFILPDEDDDESEEVPPAEGHALSDFAEGHEMRVGQTLRRQSLTSPSGRYVFVHQDDGNLVLYDTTQPYARWSSGTDGEWARLCALRAREGLVLLDDDGRVMWSSGVRRPAARLVVRDDGAVAIEDAAGTEVWSSGTAESAAPDGPAAIGDRMLPGQTLTRQSLTSPSGRRTLVHQQDGNLVLYDNTHGGAVWASGTDGEGAVRCVLLPDGDLTLYDSRARAVWSTDTGGHPGSVLTVHDDGVELRAPDGTTLWQAGEPSPTRPTDPDASEAFAASVPEPLSPVTWSASSAPLSQGLSMTSAAVQGAQALPASLEPAVPATFTPMQPAVPASSTPMEPAVPASSTPMEPAVPASSTPAEPAVPASSTPAEPAVPGSFAPMESAVPASSTPMESAVPASFTSAEPAVPASSEPADPASSGAAPASSASTASSTPSAASPASPASPGSPAVPGPSRAPGQGPDEEDEVSRDGGS